MSKKKPWQDERVLGELYHGEGMSSREVACELDTTKTTILRWMDRLDIPTRRSTKEMHPRFRLSSHGYEMLRTQVEGETAAVYHHRLLASSEFGVDPVDGQHVHHKNGIPWDNRPDNLELRSNSEHVEMHHQQGHYDHRQRDGEGKYLNKEAWADAEVGEL